MPNSHDSNKLAIFLTDRGLEAARQLKDLGREVLEIPPFQFEYHTDDSLTAIFANVSSLDLLIFADCIAAAAFLEFAGSYDIDLFALDSVTICAIGEPVADRLRFSQVHADIVPSRAVAASIFDSVQSYLGRGRLARGRVVLLRGPLQETPLIRLLSDAGTSIDDLEVYGPGMENQYDFGRTKALVKGGAISHFVFTSPEDLIFLKQIFAGEDLENVLEEISLLASDEPMLRHLEEHGLRASRLRTRPRFS